MYILLYEQEAYTCYQIVIINFNSCNKYDIVCNKYAYIRRVVLLEWSVHSRHPVDHDEEES